MVENTKITIVAPSNEWNCKQDFYLETSLKAKVRQICHKLKTYKSQHSKQLTCLGEKGFGNIDS